MTQPREARAPGAPSDEQRAQRVLLVCSSGGHLAQLFALRDWWGETDRRWVTFETADAVGLLVGETVTYGYHPTTRNLVNLARNWRLARTVLNDWRPDLIVSTGAGIAVPYFYLGRILGIRLAYLEVIDRISSPTLTGRLCYPVSDEFWVQLPEQVELYPSSTAIGPVI